jgi:Na+/melibiose symporter-like transporter
LWIQVSYRFGKHRTLAAAVIYQSATLICVILLPPGQAAGAAVAMFLAGLAANAAPFLLRSIVSDVVDKDRLETGEQRTGLFFGLMLLAAKMGLAIAPAITFGILAAVGFDSAPGASNEPRALTVLTALFIGAPVIANLLLAALMWRFPLDEAAQSALQDAISQKETGA